MKYELRDYQKECVDIINHTYSGNHLVVMATGLGKTVTMGGIERLGRTLILSHRDELVRQPQKYFDCSFGIEKANEESDQEEVVSASIQTISRSSRLEKFSPDAFDTIIVDEAHHAAAPTYKKVLSYFTPRRIIGFTATPRRGDRVRLDDVFEDIIFNRDIIWGIENGFLCNIHAIRIITNADISSVPVVAGDFQERQLSSAIIDSNMVVKTAAAYMQYCRQNNRQTIIYCLNIQISTLVLETIRAYLTEEQEDSIKMITGKTDKDERRAILEDYKQGKVKCLVNCMVLTEGFDAPETSAIIVMRPTCNDTLYQQIVGRGLRICEGKDNCLVLDMVPAGGTSKRYLCTAPSLFGEDAQLASEKQKERMEVEYDVLEMVDAIRKSIGAHKDALTRIRLLQEEFDIFANEQIEAIVNRAPYDIPAELSHFHVHINPSAEARFQIYYDAGYITISEPDVIGKVRICIYTEDKVYNKDMNLKEAAEFAYKICATSEKRAYLWAADSYKRWESEPATKAQTALLARINDYNDIDPDSLNKAQASELIDLLVRNKKAKKDLESHGIIYKKAKSARAQSTREEKALKAYEVYQEANMNKMQKGASLFNDFEERVNNDYAKIEARVKAEESRKHDLAKEWRESDVISIRISKTNTYSFSSSNSASAKQNAFISRLNNDLSRTGIVFDKHFEMFNLSEADANNMIVMLLTLKDSIPEAGIRKEAGWDTIVLDTGSVRGYLKKSDANRAEGDIILRKKQNEIQ